MATSYPKRLIEVDLPIKRISAHARREKSIRHGHISTLHIWWARRPLAACRAVICAALWPDPADPLCPEAFREVARTQILNWATEYWKLHSPESIKRFNALVKDPNRLNDSLELRHALLDFIADFANWDNSTNKEFLETSRILTQAAHEALGGEPGTKPLVVDPFAGGGAIPLEALRVGADAFASDLNPVAVLLNKVVLEYIPKYGQHLADEVRKWGQWVQEQAEKELAEFYPKDRDGATPIAYLWARTIKCEGPSCGFEVPLLRSLWLAKKGKGSVALKLKANNEEKRIDYEIIFEARAKDVGEGTTRKGSVTCPRCGFTTPVGSVRRQMQEQQGGTANARLYCVVTAQQGQQGRLYRLPIANDQQCLSRAIVKLEQLSQEGGSSNRSIIPNEILPLMSGVFNAPIYGINTWGSLFNPRQSLTLATLARLVREVYTQMQVSVEDDFANAIRSCLALAVGRLADRCSTLCTWDPSPSASGILHTFARQALPFISDFAEGAPLESKSGGWLPTLEWIAIVLEHEANALKNANGSALQTSATNHPLPDGVAQFIFTDPPYYNAVPYADLSDFFYVWLKRSIEDIYPELFKTPLTPKEDEICEMAGWDPVRYAQKNGKWFEEQMRVALSEARRIQSQDGLSIVVFAHKSTEGWEALLQAMVSAGWNITGSWPLDTEMGTRLRARNSAALASSIHLICRPREKNADTDIGDWRDILDELPIRIREWMSRLVTEGVAGADAIFACLGPAIEIFSRYSKVEKASGEQVTLHEYLEYVWAAVAREALFKIFEGVDTTGFDEDARLTALWLWTLFSGANEITEIPGEEEREEDEETLTPKASLTGGYMLEYDAARKIAQGLGVHLERLITVVEVKGEKARLLPVAERARYLFGKETIQPVSSQRKKALVQAAFPGWPTQPMQGDLFGIADQTAETDEASLVDRSTPKAGETVLDRLHQSMLLFSAGRTEALKRFLVEDGIGQDQRFWRLAQALSALYPMGSDEKRWVDGILARKKSWGL